MLDFKISKEYTVNACNENIHVDTSKYDYDSYGDYKM